MLKVHLLFNNDNLSSLLCNELVSARNAQVSFTLGFTKGHAHAFLEQGSQGDKYDFHSALRRFIRLRD